MKKTILIVFFILMFGCLSHNNNSNDGKSPVIKNVTLLKADEYSEFVTVGSYRIGDLANFYMDVSDPDLDVSYVYITQFYPFDSERPYSGPDQIPLPSQSSANKIFTLVDPVLINGPVGGWRLDFQIEDKKGNRSNIFTVFASVHK